MSLLTGSNGEDPYARNVSYQEQWREYLRKQGAVACGIGDDDDHDNNDAPSGSSGGGITVVYDCVQIILEDRSPGGGLARSSSGWVLACTSHGCVYAWMLPPTTTPSSSSSDSRLGQEDDGGVCEDEWTGSVSVDSEAHSGADRIWESDSNPSLLRSRHKWQLNPHRTALYRLQVIDTCSGGGTFFDGRILLVAGEDCRIQAYDLGRLFLQQEDVVALRRFEPYPNPFVAVPIVDFFCLCERNDTAIARNSSTTTIITAVAPDNWGLYRWRLETGDRVPLKIPGRTAADGALTCARPLLRRQQEQQEQQCGEETNNIRAYILVGSEFGVVYCLSDDETLVTQDGAWSDAKSKNHSSQRTRIDMRSQLRLPEATVTHLEIIDCWWTVAGAQSAGTHGGGGGGYVATIHAPSRSVVHWVSTRETPQRLHYFPRRHCVTVLSNTPVVQHLEVVSLDVKERWWSSLKSCHAVTTIGTGDDEDATVTVVGGVGGQLDVYRSSTRFLALGL
jgi:hypothetical protein